jgi:hypothetical protein
MNAQYLTLTKPAKLQHRERSREKSVLKREGKSYGWRQYVEDMGRGGKEG